MPVAQAGDVQKPNRLNLLFIPRDNKGCGFYRMMVPANEIKRQDLANVVVNFGWDWKLVEWAHVVIVQRMTDVQAYEAIDQAHSIGKKIIFEIDDYVNAISPQNPSFDFWSPFGPNYGRCLKIMKKCDAVQVTTDRLRNEYALWNPRIEALPNCLDKTLWDVPAWTATHWDNYYKKKNDGIIRIGWAGAASHYQDLKLVEEVITKLCQKYYNVHFVMMGYHGESKTGPDLFKNIPNATAVCPHCKHGGQLEKVPGIDLLYYPSKLKEAAFDIGIAPLIETGFNQGKSDIKIREYSALSIPVVATRMKPYSESVKEGYTGFLASTGKEWYDALELLIKDEELRKRLGRNNYRWYKENTIDKHIHKWISFYNRVVSFKFKW
jgi:glycosyltransferase involved in cell wall biosynthesis